MFIGFSHFQTLIHRICEESLDAKLEDSDNDNLVKALSTQKLLEMTRAIAGDQGNDISNFFEQWVYCDGYPQMRADLKYNAKKKCSVVELSQDQQYDSNGLKFTGTNTITLRSIAVLRKFCCCVH